MIESILDLPEWKEGIEVSDGIYRNFVAFYPQEVVKELIANAITHRSYTLNGDIFINLYPDRLEVVSPGSLPFGVTPTNILNKSEPRNQFFAEIARDVYLMEKMGSGYDKIYQLLTKDGKKLPRIQNSPDSVKVTVFNQITSLESINLMDKIGKDYQLSQKATICLGLICQSQVLSSFDLAKILDIENYDLNNYWLKDLINNEIIKSSGEKKGKKYKINSKILQQIGFKGKTSLKTIEDYRLRALIVEDLSAYGESSTGNISERIGKEIPVYHIRKSLNYLMVENKVSQKGQKKGKKYQLII
jgi:ATP-dependent DNA helicase RecG